MVYEHWALCEIIIVIKNECQIVAFFRYHRILDYMNTECRRNLMVLTRNVCGSVESFQMRIPLHPSNFASSVFSFDSNILAK